MGAYDADMIIIGAGAAGLAAALAARQAGARAIVLEARDRIGGRAHTEAQSLGVPFDRGAAWLHSGSINPLAELATREGFRFDRRSVTARTWEAGRWAGNREEQERNAYLTRAFEAINAAGRAGHDVGAWKVVEQHARWTPMLRYLVAAINGVDLEQLSTLDQANQRDTQEDWPVREGLGALIAHCAQGLPVRLGEAAEAVRWDGPAVQVRTRRGWYRAPAVIITVSTGVLGAGHLRFQPELPDWKREAFAALPMGCANKIAFTFDDDVFGMGEHTYASRIAGHRTMGFHIRPFGWDMAVGYLGGRLCQDLEREGGIAMLRFGEEALVSMFGEEIRRRITASTATRWQSDPYTLGGYSAARPGQAHRRLDLAAPLDGRVFFAGEACSVEFPATAHGAYLTGVAAAEAAAAEAPAR